MLTFNLKKEWFEKIKSGEKLKASVLSIKIIDGQNTDLKINKDAFDIEFELI